MGATNKFHVLTFLNYLGGGENCSLSIFDERLHFYSPEIIAMGEPKRVLDDLRKTSLFVKDPDQKMELLHSTELENMIIAELRVPNFDRDLFALVIFEFSDKGISKIQSFYPSSRTLTISEEFSEAESLRLSSDIEFFGKLLETGQKNLFFQLFEEDALIRDAHGHYFGLGACDSFEDFWARYSRASMQILKCIELGKICIAEVRWRRNRGVFVWVRSESKKFLSCRFYGNEKPEQLHLTDSVSRRVIESLPLS